jgi:hypothetical protein
VSESNTKIIESITAIQMKALEDSERRISPAVWHKCFVEGQAAYAAQPESMIWCKYYDRDMAAAYRLGWYLAQTDAEAQKRFLAMDRKAAEKKQSRPRKRKRKGAL